MTDYGMFYRRCIGVNRISKELSAFDVFVSAYNSSDRVIQVFSEVKAARKIWMIHPEYQYLPVDLPAGYETVNPDRIDEVQQVGLLLASLGDLKGKALCVDITGFMRHVLVFLVAKLAREGLKVFTVLYSEPKTYIQQEHTTFSTTTSGVVRPIRGMAGSNHSNGKDLLIIGVGYDHKLISEIANHKDGSIVYPLFAFPSLSPDMYQQSAVRASASGAVALSPEWVANRRFAPANDPFSTAAAVADIIAEVDRNGAPCNVYLAPVSTKAQALGFAIYWQREGLVRGAVSIISPECLTYSRETSIGLQRLWEYTVEF
jgi:hypothetical protein